MTARNLKLHTEKETDKAKTKKQVPKRGNSRGSIRRLPSGKYQPRLTIEDLNGATRRVPLGTYKTKTEAEAALSAALTDAARGQFAVTERTTIEEYIKAWHEVKKRSQAATYARSHESMMNTHVIPGLGKRKLNSITPRDLDIFYAGLTSHRKYGKARSEKQQEVKPLGDSMKRLIHNMLHQMFSEAVKHGDLLRNPADVTRPRYTREAAQNNAPKAWTDEEAARFYQVAHQDARGVVFCFAMSSGLRIGEVLGLRWENVEMDEDFARIQIAEVLVSVNGKRHQTTPKTTRSWRDFKAKGDMLAILREQHALVETFREANPTRYQASDAVFTNYFGGSILPDTVYKPMRRLCEQAGVPYKGTHVLRHSYISIMGMHGTPVEVISAHVGHARASFTRDRYRSVFGYGKGRHDPRFLSASRKEEMMAENPVGHALGMNGKRDMIKKGMQ